METCKNKIADAILARTRDESGPDYGMMAESERRQVREHNRTLIELADFVRNLKT